MLLRGRWNRSFCRSSSLSWHWCTSPRRAEEHWLVGVSTTLDRITTQIDLVHAGMNLVTARCDYQIARAELEALAGR